MAETIRHAALSLLILLIGVGCAAANTVMTGLDVVSTSGTMTLRKLESTRSTLSDDQRRVIAEDLNMQIQLDSGQTAHCTADEGMVVISGYKPRPEDAVNFPINAESVEKYAEVFEQYASPGDILLVGKDHPAKANFGDSGTIETQKLIWSDWLAHYFLPTIFQQEAQLENGSVLKISGASASISRDLNNWTYYGDDKNAAAIVYVRSATDEESK